MEQYVDFFGFMAYDLHGSWDSDVLTLGKLVRGQTDIREISNNTIPLWFDGLDPAKINFGLAMYGRGYTLGSAGCSDLLCPFIGPSKPGPCTGFEGVMSLNEIKQLIKDRGITPKYLQDSMMKQITWDDQWIGYDDEETFAAKKAWADARGFGGTMVSILSLFFSLHFISCFKQSIWCIGFSQMVRKTSRDWCFHFFLFPRLYRTKLTMAQIWSIDFQETAGGGSGE